MHNRHNDQLISTLARAYKKILVNLLVGSRWMVRFSRLLQQQQQQQQLVPLQDSYMQSRAEALQNVESTIHELSNIFNQLATLVSQQGEIAIRFYFYVLPHYIFHVVSCAYYTATFLNELNTLNEFNNASYPLVL